MKRLALVVLAGCLSKPAPGRNDHLDDPVRLAAGRKHACRIDDAQQVWCWGRNDRGQLGQPLTVAESGRPLLANSDAGWTWIAAGDTHTCGLRDARVYCWGRDVPAPTEMVLPRPAIALYAGGDTTCAITEGRELQCWSSGSPAALKPAGRTGSWRSIAFADDHTCALLDGDNAAYCWGSNDRGQLGGDSLEADVDVANAIGNGDVDLVAIAVGPGVTCGITVGRALACWGAAERTGAMEDGPDVTVDSTRRWTALAIGTQHVCAVGDGSVYCTGTDERGALGSFDGVMMEPVTTAGRVVAGDSFSCAENGASVSCWGANEFGELGNHEVASKRAPIAVGTTATQLSLGAATSCAIDGAGIVSCWGDNRAGQIEPEGEPLITRPKALGSYLAVAAGGRHTCAITASAAAIDCWGANDAAQLGTEDPDAVRATLSATSLPNTTTFVELAAGARSTCALTDRGEIVCWGDLPGGATKRPPTAINGIYEHVAVGKTFAIAAVTQSPRDTFVVGAIGDCIESTTFPRAQPIVAGATNGASTIAIAAHQDASHFCVLEDARLTCGGLNDAGQVAQTNTLGCRPPAAVVAPASGTWGSSIAIGGDHTCAIDASARLYCWGGNDHGELAGIQSAKTTPQLLGSLTWTAVATSTFHSCGIAPTGDVLCWGENRFGELGDGTSYHPLPIDVVP